MPPIPTNFCNALHFDPTYGACDVGKMWATLRWTHSLSLVTVSQSNFEILHFICIKCDRITYKQTEGQTKHCMPPADLSGRGHINSVFLAAISLQYLPSHSVDICVQVRRKVKVDDIADIFKVYSSGHTIFLASFFFSEIMIIYYWYFIYIYRRKIVLRFSKLDSYMICKDMECKSII